jgi:hypothetical protein
MSAPLKKIQLYRIPDRLLATDSCLRVWLFVYFSTDSDTVDHLGFP